MVQAFDVEAKASDTVLRMISAFSGDSVSLKTSRSDFTVFTSSYFWLQIFRYFSNTYNTPSTLWGGHNKIQHPMHWSRAKLSKFVAKWTDHGTSDL